MHRAALDAALLVQGRSARPAARSSSTASSRRTGSGSCRAVRQCQILSGHSPPLSQIGQSKGCDVTGTRGSIVAPPSPSPTSSAPPCLPRSASWQAVSSFGPNWSLGWPFVVKDGCPCSVHQRASHLHQAHAAHGPLVPSWVIAEHRDVDARALQHRRSACLREP